MVWYTSTDQESWPPSLRRRVAHLPPRGRKPTLAPSPNPPNVAPRAAGRGSLPGPTFMISSLEMEDHTYLIILLYVVLPQLLFLSKPFLGFFGCLWPIAQPLARAPKMVQIGPICQAGGVKWIQTDPSMVLICQKWSRTAMICETDIQIGLS